MKFYLGATVGRRIGDPYLMRHLAAESADLMLVNLPHCNVFSQDCGEYNLKIANCKHSVLVRGIVILKVQKKIPKIVQDGNSAKNSTPQKFEPSNVC
jgi:rRNA maturation protein Nop10